MRSILANSTCPIEFVRLLLARSADEEKQSQLQCLADFHARHAKESPAMLKRLQQAVMENKNVFEVAEIGAWLPASWCQMPTNRRRAIPQSLLAASLVHVASLLRVKDKSAAVAVNRGRCPV
jgi:hypothetical protein